MNGIHDLGGMHGFGSVAVDDADPFHADWERRVFGLRTAMLIEHGAPRNLDEARYEVEKLEPHIYLTAGYFERWLLAGEQIYVNHGLLNEEEIGGRKRELAEFPDAPLPSNDD